MPFRLLLLAGFLAAATAPAQTAAPAAPPAATPLRPEDTPAQDADTPAAEAAAAEPTAPVGRPVTDWTEVQVALHRAGFSCGSIDGVRGAQSAAALSAWQHNEGLNETGDLDRATRAALLVTDPVYTTTTLTVEEMIRIKPAPVTWLEKSQEDELYYTSALEAVAEHSRASPKLIQRLNPDVNWDQVLPGTKLKVPAVAPFTTPLKAARIHIRLAEHVLEVTTDEGRIILHCPVSIARMVEKRPVGELKVVVIAPNPDYTFDPAVFPESPEAQALGRKLLLSPGPNNPVGLAWIGLDRPGYGIHGTPDPEKVGRTESHGCFRLANWDAVALLSIVWVGLPVVVEP